MNRLILVKSRTNQQVCVSNSRWSRSALTLLEHADVVSDNEMRHVPGVWVCAELAVLVMGCGTAWVTCVSDAGRYRKCCTFVLGWAVVCAGVGDKAVHARLSCCQGLTLQLFARARPPQMDTSPS